VNSDSYISVKKAAEFKGMTQRRIRQLCEKGAFVGAVKNGSRWTIPISADPKFTGVRWPADLSREVDLTDVPARKQEEAVRRLGLIKEFEKFSAAHVHSGGTRSDAQGLFVSGNEGVSVRSLQRWIRRYKDEGLAGLIDTRGGGKFVSQVISQEAFEYFKSMYLTPQQRSVRTCWQNICYINKTEDRGWNIPGLKCMYRYIKDRIPQAAQVLHREGVAAYEAKYAPYIQIDPRSIQPGQIWVGDHHQFNCWVRYRNKWVRPWITQWNDMGSRAAVGWYISAAPNQLTIMQAMKRGVEKYGPPESVKIDNGRDYDSEMFTGTTKVKRRLKVQVDERAVAGIYAMMDVGVSFSIPYHPQSKPVERWFDTLDRQFTKTFDTYCGKDSKRKPEDLNEYLQKKSSIKNAHTLESFAELANEYIIKVYNNNSHQGNGMEGRSPNEVMASRTSRRVLANGVVELLLRGWSGELKVGKNGVRFKGVYYGQYNIDLLAYQGRKVRLAYDPDDLREVQVYDSTAMRLITTAEQNQFVRYGDPVSDEALRQAMKDKSRVAKAMKAQRDISLVDGMDLTTLTLKAMADAAKDAPEADNQQVSLRPVSTPFDGQVAEHKRRHIQRQIKKAVGAENTPVVDLDLDLSLLDTGEGDIGGSVDCGFDFTRLGNESPNKKGVSLKLFEQ